MSKDQTNITGRKGEDAACAFLEAKGYTILARNYTVRYGELDIIAQKEEIVVFAEVKTRRNTRYGRACEAVSPAKQRKLIAAANLWLAETGYGGAARFDVIEVYASGAVEQIENAFWVT